MQGLQSRPSWARGLKHRLPGYAAIYGGVASLVGAWIETVTKVKGGYKATMSRPSWARGLKQGNILSLSAEIPGRVPRGRVD